MDAKEFKKELIEDVRSAAIAYGEGTNAAFVNLFADYLIEADIIPSFEESFYLGTGLRKRKIRVDGYFYDEFDSTLNLIVADFKGSEIDEILARKEAEQVFEWPVRFIKEIFENDLYHKVEISTTASDLIDLVIKNKEKIKKYRVLLFTDKFMSGRIESFPLTEFDGAIIEYQIWDMERLYKAASALAGNESIEIDFTQYTEKGLPCIEASATNLNEYKCFLSVIPGEVIADIYDLYGAQLLEGNVRSFLSTKVAVNKKIRETILKEPTMFFAFNNGISATAMGVTVKNTDEGKYITNVKDFQIINGGQTTASLSNARYRDKADLSNLYLQMKVTELNEDFEETQELLQKISRSSNSQNKVSDADFFSTHPYHIRMEQISKRIFAPAVGGAQHDTHWFYERARGQYLQAQMRMTQAEKKRFLIQNPKNQLLSKTELAKARNSWRGYPHVVSKGAQKNFTEYAKWIDSAWSTSDISFNEKYFQESVALYILFKHVETLVSKQLWYQQGYRANIVTYSIALFSQALKKQYPKQHFDLLGIWTKQEVPKSVTKIMEVITKRVMDSISDPSRGHINVTQWCKQEACWNRVKEIDIELNSSISKLMLHKDEVKSENKKAREDQSLVSGLQAQEAVINKGAEFWLELNKFVAGKRIASPSDVDALKIACKIPLKLPNSIHSQKLLILIDKAIAEGWKEV